MKIPLGIRSTNPTRPGLTLVEVLAAIFVLAIGALSVLVLFPVGAMKVKAALDNERIARCAANGAGVLKMASRAYSLANPDSDKLANFFVIDFYQKAEINGGTTFFTGKSAIVDPYFKGQSLYGLPNIKRQGLNGGNLSITDPDFDSIKDKLFSIGDDLEFELSGNPPNPFGRTKTFTVAYLINQSEGFKQYDFSVLVFKGRNTLANITENYSQINGSINSINLDLLETSAQIVPIEDRMIQPNSYVLITSIGSNSIFEFRKVLAVQQNSTTDIKIQLDKPLKYSGTVTAFWIDNLVNVTPRGNFNQD